MDSTSTRFSELDATLERLVARGVLTPAQSAEVRTAIASESKPGATPEERILIDRPTISRSTISGRLGEVAGYLGAVLVAASLVTLVAQRWEELSGPARVGLMAGLGVIAFGLGLGVALRAGVRALRERAHAARRRVTGALLALGAVLLGVAASQLVTDDAWPGLVGSAVAFALLVVAHYLAPSAITEIGTFGALLVVVGTGTNLMVPEDVRQWTGEGPPPSRWQDYLTPIGMALTGLVWAAAVAHRVTLTAMATVLGLATALIATITLAGQEMTRAGGITVLAILAVIGVVGFLVWSEWPWVGLTVGAITAGVFIIVLDSGAPAFAFLVAGIVLLAGAWVATSLGRRGPNGGRGRPTGDPRVV